MTRNLMNELQKNLGSSALTSRLMDLKAIESAQKMGHFYDYVAQRLGIPRDAAKTLVYAAMYSAAPSVIDEMLFEIRSYKSGLIVPTSRA